MRRLFGFLLLAATLAAIAFAVGLGCMFAAFNPNDYKEQIGAAVERATGRQVIFHDDLKASFLPKFGMETGRISLVEPGMYGGEAFLSVENAYVYIVPESILHKILVVDSIILKGARLNLITAADGSRNWEYGFTSSPEGATQAVPLGPLPADNPVAVAAEASPPAGQNGAAESSDWRVYLQSATIQCADALVAYTDALGVRQWEMEIERLDVYGNGSDAVMNLAASGLFKDASSGDKSSFSLDAEVHKARKGLIAASVRSLRLQFEGVGDLPLQLDSVCSMTYDWNIGLVELENLQGVLYAAAHAGGEASSDSAFRSDYSGRLSIILPHGEKSATIRGVLNAGNLNLDTLLHGLDPTVQFMEADVSAIRGAPNFTRPKVNRLRGGVATAAMMGPQKRSAAAPAATPAVRESASPGSGPGWYESLLSGISLDLDVKADVMTVRQLSLRKLSAKLHSMEKQTTLPYSFELFGGSVEGTCTADLTDELPAFSFASNARGMRVGELCTALGARFGVGGVGVAALDLSGSGKSLNEILHSLKGEASFEIIHGEIRGFGLIPPDLPHIQGVPEEFLFTRFAASVQVLDGTASSSDILLESARVSGQGRGVVHLPFGQMDVGMDFMIAGRPPAIPVGISGPYGALASSVDMKTFTRNAEQRNQSPYGGGSHRRGGGIVMDEYGNLYPR